MLQRRGAGVSLPATTHEEEGGKSLTTRLLSPKSNARRYTYIFCAAALLLAAAHLITLDGFSASSPSTSTSTSTSTSSSSSTKSNYSALRASSSISTFLPDFKPIHDQCSIWMAPSSLKGVNGYGVFTTRDLDEGEHIIGRPDGMAIPMERDFDRAPKRMERTAWYNMWGNYVWGRGVPDHARYYAGKGVLDYQLGFGALPNHHCILESLDYVYPDPPYDDTLVDRFSDPGAGAFTYHRGRQFTVSRPLSSGSEFFLDYGYCRHSGGHLHIPDWVDHVYVTGDYEEASTLIWDAIRGREGALQFDETGKLIPPPRVARLVRELLPQTRKELSTMKKEVKSKEDLTWYLATHKSLQPHSPDWIRENGLCLENILPYKSTLPHAGQGAFAQYHIRAGDIVFPAPLLQIMDEELLVVYEKGKRIGEQLLLNYCFGHPESSLLLCPDTQADLINHCSSRTKQCGKKGPNAAIRWSTGWDPTSEEWRKKSLDEIAKEPGRGLAFEIYSLRDIQPGEEVFIDYGREWERAWEKHVETWTPPEKPSQRWITAKEANDNMEEILPEFISGDLRKTVNHPYLFTVCQYYASKSDKDDMYKKKNARWTELPDQDILEYYSDEGTDYGYRDDNGYSTHHDHTHWPCSVLYEEEKGFYAVRIHQSGFEDDLPWEENDVPRILTSYSRSNIHYFVKRFSSDHFLPGAFRHPLGIPDEMFPEQWKNRKALS